MREVVIPINDARDAEAAARRAIELYRSEMVHIHLLNVQRPMPKHIAQFFSRNELRDIHRDAGMRALEGAARLLDEAAVPYQPHVLVGKPAETIVRFADEHHCSEVVLDGRQQIAMLSRLGIGSIASQVRHLMSGGGAAAATGARSR